MSKSTDIRIAILDEDHVLELFKCLLSWENDSSKQYVNDFFAPEFADESVLRGFSEKVRTLGHVAVADGVDAALQADIIICRRGELTGDMILQNARLRLVQRLGSSVRGIDVDILRDRQVSLSLLPRRSLEQVADHAMLLMLSISRRVTALAPAMARFAGANGEAGAVSYNWPAISGIHALESLRLGIVGYGEIGKRLARRARAFGMEVLYAEKVRLPMAVEVEEGLTFLELDRLLSEADFVSVHVPPTGLTRPLIGSREFALMKKGAAIINTSRGASIDQEALVEALRAGRIAGAGLDVFTAEPLSADNVLFDVPNLIVTPHIAGGSRLDVLHELAAICDNIAAVMSGNLPPHARVLP